MFILKHHRFLMTIRKKSRGNNFSWCCSLTLQLWKHFIVSLLTPNLVHLLFSSETGPELNIFQNFHVLHHYIIIYDKTAFKRLCRKSLGKWSVFCGKAVPVTQAGIARGKVRELSWILCPSSHALLLAHCHHFPAALCFPRASTKWWNSLSAFWIYSGNSGLKISSKNIFSLVSVPVSGAAMNVRKQENQLCMAACCGVLGSYLGF